MNQIVGRLIASLCNFGTFELEKMEQPDDIEELRRLIENHKEYTGSTVAAHVLDNWETELGRFVKVMPTDYKRVLEEMAQANVKTAAVGS